MNGEQQAKAWKTYIESDEGKKASDPNTLGSTLSARNYLENRLWHAFNAGVQAEKDNPDGAS
jgi:hypothetical protein